MTPLGWLVLIWLASLPAKLIAAHNMVWDVDIVPVVTHATDLLTTGALPAYGTLASVAAFNLPGLVWLHLPANLFTHDPYALMLLTLLAFNAISTVYVFLLGRRVAGASAGLLAALFFTFSEISVSGSYTAWAQLLLPGFFAMTAYHLLCWCRLRSGPDLALAGVIATFASMTHFSAVLLYAAMFGLALLYRARWQVRWLLFGAALCLLLLAPYIAFQFERDFRDLRAFITQTPTIPQETLRAYEQQYGGVSVPQPHSRNSHENTAASAEAAIATADTTGDVAPSRLGRVLQFGLSIPGQIAAGWSVGYDFTPRGLQASLPLAAFGLNVLMWGLFALFVLGALILVMQRLRWWGNKTGQIHLDAEMLLAFLLLLTVGLIVSRTAPWENATYYSGLIGLQWPLTAFALVQIWCWLARIAAARGQNLKRLGVGFSVLVLVGYGLLHSAERVERIRQHDDAGYSAYNAWLYRHIDAATTWIAHDWQRSNTSDALAVSYDFFPEMAHMWWVVAWHTVDDDYRMGMSYDYLLRAQHGLYNSNSHAAGLMPEAAADYIVTYTPSLADYDLDRYEQQRFGALVVLKPLNPGQLD